LLKDWREQIFGYIGQILNNMGHKTIIINGVEDHIHVLYGMKPTHSVSDTMRDIKSNSSKWLNESGLLRAKFNWQDGYGAFSLGKSQLNHAYKYIQNQEIHHSKLPFREEFKALLEKYEVEFEDQYIFTDPE
jgi:putative transposase